MEEQDSILLQKKMILAMSAIIFVLMFSLTVFKNGYTVSKAIALKELNSNLITVNKNDDDIILIEQIAYAAVEKIVETDENKIEEENQNNEETKENTKEEKLVEEVISDALVVNEEIIQTEENSFNIESEEKELIVESIAEVKETKQPEIKEESKEENKVETKYKSYKELAENNPPAEYSKKIEATATAYCLCKKCCGKSPSHPMYGYTASGIKITPGTGTKVIAVDSNVIPLGTKVYVEGLNGAWDYGYAIAADTGSAIKNLKIDLYMDTHEECFSWGVKKVNVYVMD